MMAPRRHGKVVVVSGPSGVGKTTVLRQLLQCSPVPLVHSVSATTRSPRPGEVNGVDYYFLDAGEFDRRRQRGEFLECFQVFGRGYWYGTLIGEVTPSLEAGKWVLLEIDVQGALAVLAKYPDAVTIFLRPSSLCELERRLRGRGTESEEAIQRRLEQAKQELAEAHRYRYQVVNDTDRVDQAVRELCNLLVHEAGVEEK
jgi:guanylate kinase